MKALMDNLVRTRPDAEAARVADGDDGRHLQGHFSVFGIWYEVNSTYEGRFMERTMPGAFTQTLAAGMSRIKAQFQHGKDPFVGGSTLGPFTELREDARGGFYDIALIDTDYNRDRIIPQARAGLLGASFRFSVPSGGDRWEERAAKSAHNPLGLPERSIHEAEVYELGPVIFGASSAASAMLRSDTDEFVESLLTDPVFLARYAERVGSRAVEEFLGSLPPTGSRTEHNDEAAPQGTSSAQRKARRSAWLREHTTPILQRSQT